MKMATTNMLRNLRACMKDVTYVVEPIHAYIVPSADAHQNEYIAQCDARREFISGFTGSAGTAVITQTEALLWTDGRYYLQCEKQLDSNWKLMKEDEPSIPKIDQYLSENLPPNSRVGVDGTLYSYRFWKSLETELKLAGHDLVSIETNLIDLIWENKPLRPSQPLITLGLNYTGEKSADKLKKIIVLMKNKKVGMYIVTKLDDIAYILNLRGADISFNPVFFSYLIININAKMDLFIDQSKITPEILNHFKSEQINVEIHEYTDFYKCVPKKFEELNENYRGWVSPLASYNIVNLIPQKYRYVAYSPITEMKSIKNEVERKGMLNAHIKDGAALACFFSWLEKQVKQKAEVTEFSVVEELHKFRKMQEDFVSESFSTISAFGPHGAIIHFNPSVEEDLQITDKALYLCDSGAQFKDGTTDLTRTMHFGTPTEYEKECFTRVYKGQTFFNTAIFPYKTVGNVLDSYARRFLWEIGLNYNHGTSHGVGSFLNVHEDPIRISWRSNPDDPGLQEGMFLSDEPGYYEAGKFGIRIEDVVQVVKASTPHRFNNKDYLTFEKVSFVPIQTKMIQKSLLTTEELIMLNKYNSQVRKLIAPLLDKQGQTEAKEWLLRETEPL